MNLTVKKKEKKKGPKHHFTSERNGQKLTNSIWIRLVTVEISSKHGKWNEKNLNRKDWIKGSGWNSKKVTKYNDRHVGECKMLSA